MNIFNFKKVYALGALCLLVGEGRAVAENFSATQVSTTESSVGNAPGLSALNVSDKAASRRLAEAEQSTNAVITNRYNFEVGTVVKSVCEGFQAVGEKFTHPVGVDWNTQKVVAEINIANCGSGTQDLFSIGDDATSWNVTNIHVYKDKTGYITSYFNEGHDGCASSGNVVDGAIVRIELSKGRGLVLNNKVLFSSEKISQYSDIFGLSSVVLGSGEGTNQESKALYNFIRVVDKDYHMAGTEVTTNVLDETAVNEFAAQTSVNVQLKRTLSSKSWNTFCVPFNISRKVLVEKFGDGVQLRVFGRIEGSTIYFYDAQGIEAGKPYLVQPANDVVNPSFEGVDIVAGDPKKDGNSGYFMQGLYGVKTDLTTDGTNLFLSDDYRFYTAYEGHTKMKGLRAYFIVPSGTNYANMRTDIDAGTTSINAVGSVDEQSSDNRIYNLQGQFVGTSLNGLHGVYVQNGKKVLVK